MLLRKCQFEINVNCIENIISPIFLGINVYMQFYFKNETHSFKYNCAHIRLNNSVIIFVRTNLRLKNDVKTK